MWIDLDRDGDRRTGWLLFIMHLGSARSAQTGDRVETGDILGYPSCEGGISTGAHLHIARMYNGQWMPAGSLVPFQLGNWRAEAIVGASYDGRLHSITGKTLVACDCRSARKNRFPEKLRYSGP